MNITPLRLAGVPLHPVSLAARHLPVGWQDATARAIQRLAFGDLTRLGYPRSALGAFTRQATDDVTIAVDDGFARALKTGRISMKPAIDHFDGPHACFTDGTTCSPDVLICATGYRPSLELIAGHLVALDRHGMPPYTGPVSSRQHPGSSVHAGGAPIGSRSAAAGNRSRELSTSRGAPSPASRAPGP
jgi:hypothetical protein